MEERNLHKRRECRKKSFSLSPLLIETNKQKARQSYWLVFQFQPEKFIQDSHKGPAPLHQPKLIFSLILKSIDNFDRVS